MSVMEFLYVTWDVTGMDDNVPDWMTSDEKLLVSSAVMGRRHALRVPYEKRL